MIHFAPKHILCPVDLSPASGAVLSWARLFAEAFSARVEVLHAAWSQPPRYFTEGEVEDLAAAAELGKQKLRDDLECLAKRVLGTRVDYDIVVDDGHAVEVIQARVNSHRPDLIVLGSHGHSRVARLLMGSVAENVVREADCPTLIVKGPELAVERKQLRHVVCPVNLTETAAECAWVSSAVALAVGATIDVIQSVEQADKSKEETHLRLCEWVPDGVRKQCQVSPLVLKGDAAEQIILFAREHQADLIVLGAEHRRFLEFTVLGRTTERVMWHSPCSVLVVPRAMPTRK